MTAKIYADSSVQTRTALDKMLKDMVLKSGKMYVHISSSSKLTGWLWAKGATSHLYFIYCYAYSSDCVNPMIRAFGTPYDLYYKSLIAFFVFLPKSNCALFIMHPYVQQA